MIIIEHLHWTWSIRIVISVNSAVRWLDAIAAIIRTCNLWLLYRLSSAQCANIGLAFTSSKRMTSQRQYSRWDNIRFLQYQQCASRFLKPILLRSPHIRMTQSPGWRSTITHSLEDFNMAAHEVTEGNNSVIDTTWSHVGLSCLQRRVG